MKKIIAISLLLTQLMAQASFAEQLPIGNDTKNLDLQDKKIQEEAAQADIELKKAQEEAAQADLELKKAQEEAAKATLDAKQAESSNTIGADTGNTDKK